MADKTEARTRRTAARDRRRSKTTDPAESKDQEAGDQAEQGTPQQNGELAGAAAKVVGTAVAAGLLGALGGAAKALLERRRPEPESTNQGDDGADAEPEPAASAEPSTREQEDDEPSALAEEDEDDRPEPEEREPALPEREAQGEPQERPQGPSQERAQGVSGDEAAEIVAAARRQLEGLLDTEAERVSGLERADGRWYVMLEVVEVSRIPESTDVMATYELVLDDERNLVSANRRRRYRRSQIDEAS